MKSNIILSTAHFLSSCQHLVHKYCQWHILDHTETTPPLCLVLQRKEVHWQRREATREWRHQTARQTQSSVLQKTRRIISCVLYTEGTQRVHMGWTRTITVLLLTLLNGACTQSCQGCAPQPAYIAPQSVVLTVPMQPVQRLNNGGQVVASPCCTPPKTITTWMGQPTWNANGQQRTNYMISTTTGNNTQGMPVNYQNAIYGQQVPNQPQPQAPNYNYTYVPPGYLQNQQPSTLQPNYNNPNMNQGGYPSSTPPSNVYPVTMTAGQQPTNYNNVNQGFQSTVTPSTGQNNNYNNVNGGFVEGGPQQQQNTNYNDPNQGYQGGNNQGGQTTNYNDPNQGYQQGGPQQQGGQQQPQGNYNDPNQGYQQGGQQQGGQQVPQENYNDPNQGYQGGNNQGGQPTNYNDANQNYDQGGTMGPGGQNMGQYNDANSQYQQGGATGMMGPQEGQPGYNGPNGGYVQTGPDGEYTSVYEGTFSGPANPQPNQQGNMDYDQPMMNVNGGSEQGGTQNVLFPAAQINQGPSGGNVQYPNQQFNQGGQPGQQATAQGSYQGGPSPQPNGQGQFQDTQGQFPYSTNNPNAGWAPTEAPMQSTQGYSPNQGDFAYSTTYNPNSEYGQQQGGGYTMAPSDSIYVSPINDQQFDGQQQQGNQNPQQGQFQSTTPYPGSTSNNFGQGVAAGAAAGALAAGGLAGALGYQGSSTTTPYPNQSGFQSTTVPNQGGVTQGGTNQNTATPYGSTTPGSSSSGGNMPSSQQYQSTTPFGMGGQYPSSTGAPFNDEGMATGTQHSDMNYQYSKGADGVTVSGGSTVSPGFAAGQGSTQAFTQNDATGGGQQFNPSTNSPMGQGGVNGVQYDHSNMNTQYGQYGGSTNMGDTMMTTPPMVLRDQIVTSTQRDMTRLATQGSTLLLSTAILIFALL